MTGKGPGAVIDYVKAYAEFCAAPLRLGCNVERLSVVNGRFEAQTRTTTFVARQVVLAHDDASTTVSKTCRVLGISKSSYYAALREGRRQALETDEAA